MHIGDFCDDHVWGMIHDGGDNIGIITNSSEADVLLIDLIVGNDKYARIWTLRLE
jgi:hypothetical protein